MPNHCSNELTIYGTPKELAKIRKFVKTRPPKVQPAEELIKRITEEIEIHEFDFESIVPPPEELKEIHSGGCHINGTLYTKWRTINGKDIGIDKEEQEKLTELYGAACIYDWCCNFWGTKWNAYDGTFVEQEKDQLRYEFTTAWSPPAPVLEALSKKFPKNEIELNWSEEGGTEGYMTFLNGECTHDESGESERDEGDDE